MNSTSRCSSGGVGGGADESPEESSWTMYFEDFSNYNNNNIIIDMNYQTSSLVSDAASSDVTRRHVFGANSLDHKISYNRLSTFKNKKSTKGAAASLVDDELEDTASSPANSPKVCDLVNDFDKNLKQKGHVMNISQGIKGSASSGQIDDELKKRRSLFGSFVYGSDLCIINNANNMF